VDLFSNEKMRWTWLTARGPGAWAGPSWTCELGWWLGSSVSGALGLRPLGACRKVGKRKREPWWFIFCALPEAGRLRGGGSLTAMACGTTEVMWGPGSAVEDALR
jgi:hypothetical protein